MSGILNSNLNGAASNISDSSGRPFATSFSAPSAAGSGFHHSGGLQGLHDIHGSFNVANMPGLLASRSAAMSGIPSSGVQQPGGSISSGRFASNNIPVAMSQITHGSSHGHSGVINRGGIGVVGNPSYSGSMNGIGSSIPGMSASSMGGNRNSVPGVGVSPIIGSVRPQMTSSIGNAVGSGSIGRSITSGGLSVPGLTSRVNLAANNGSAGHNIQGTNRMISGMLQQSPQMIGLLGNSFPAPGGPLSQSQLQAGNNQLSPMGILNDVGSSDTSAFDANDFPQLNGVPNSAGGSQGQLGSLRKHGIDVSSIIQQNQEFSIQNEDFPALPGFKGGSSDFSMDLHQKEQLHENMSIMQSQQMRSGGFSLGGNYPLSRQQQQHAASISSHGISFSPGNNQDFLRLNGSDLFPSSHGSYQNSGTPNIGLRPLSSPNLASGLGYEQFIQQYQHPQNQSQFRLQQMSGATHPYRDQTFQPMQGTQTTPDRFGLLGLLSVIRMNDAELSSLALGIDLTTLGFDLTSADSLHETFKSPWSDKPAKEEPEYSVPDCYYARQTPSLQQKHFPKFQLQTLFYIFYSMPRDAAQIYAACELHSRGWYYHKELKLWFTRIANTEPLVKTNTHERGSYIFFDKDSWEAVRKDNFVLQYEAVEKKPTLPPSPQH